MPSTTDATAQPRREWSSAQRQPTEGVAVGDAANSDSVNPLYGVIEAVRPGRIGGWVIDRRDPAAAVTVEIRREGRLVAEVPADRPRPDLTAAGLGTGRYGFQAALEPPVEPGFEFTVTATARGAEGATASLRRPATTEPSSDRRLLERIHMLLWDRPEAAAAPSEPRADGAGDFMALCDRIDALTVALDRTRVQTVRRSGAALGLAALAFIVSAASLTAAVASLLR